MIVIAIPLFYQCSAYRPYTVTPQHPTTTAKYITLSPSTCPATKLQNCINAKDVMAWGRAPHEVLLSAPQTRKWWTGYKAPADKHAWYNDIRRIWEREHGFLIAERYAHDDEQREQEGEAEKTSAVLRGVKKLGQRTRQSRHAAERNLRRLDEAERRLRAEKRWSKWIED